MNVLVAGSSGLIGSALVGALEQRGDSVTRLVRREPRAGQAERRWNPTEGVLDRDAVSGFDAVVHLSGESLADGRWTSARKKRLLSSRIDTTRLLSERLASLEQKPGVLVSASAIGVYGDRGDEVLTEDSPPGDGFLANLCLAWEQAADPARSAGVRVVHVCFGLVLSPLGGVLAKMLPPFKMGLGGVLGSGKQYMSWIAIGDAISAIEFVLENRAFSGRVNITSPEPVTNREFTKTLGHVLHRPTTMHVPAFAIRLAAGELGDEALLASQRVVPRSLQENGFRFRYPTLEHALRDLLGR
jgi:uncharacterized protein (TIGR01777 family)